MDPVPDRERLLVPHWAPELIFLSYCISWLGAYTSTQIIIHAKYTRNTWVKWIWTFLASLAFGFCAIWCMHFVGMLACRLDIRVGFNANLTILSAIVAVAFTFAALTSAYLTDAIENSNFVKMLILIGKAIRKCIFSCGPERDPEAGYEALGQEGDEDERRHRTSQDEGDDDDDAGQDPRYDEFDGDEEEAALERQSLGSRPDMPHTVGGSLPTQITSPQPAQLHTNNMPARGRTRSFLARAPLSQSQGQGHNHARTTTLRSPPLVRQRSLPPLRRISAEGRDSPSILSSSLSSSDSSTQRQRARSGSDSTLSGSTLASSGRTASTESTWAESLHVGLSRETRMRIRARARDRPVPVFGWWYWMRVSWKTVTALVIVRAAVWGMALVLMHYCGMWAMYIPGGRISWNPGIVILSYIVAFAVCLVACIFMEHMEVNFGRQFAFSTIAAFGVCSMHYTGMAAATFYTHNSPAPPGQAGYPQYLPITIISIAVAVCVVSNVVLAHSAITARNRMAEMILTKRRLWRIMAEKEAAEQANELKQQFISVASHEIRTPLHTVNGYCELLARTQLTEEQALYVTSIQQACHAINVIAGNVLDFSKLDRDNVELTAQPVLMQLRKVVEDLARIQPSQPGLNVVVSIAPDVPKMVYLDETYTFRVLMNLLSNAQKFCDKGYICVVVSMVDPRQLMIQVRDTGCGIPTSFRAALFEPFRQADTSLTRPRQGTGLGLSIVKHLVQRMNGSIVVESQEGEGSTFTVKLPVSRSSTEQSPRPDEIPLSDLADVPPQSAIKRIRIVYSDPRTEALYVELWAQHGHVPSSGLTEGTLQDLARHVDCVWTDVESVASSGVLRELLRAETSRPLPVYIVHTESRDLSVLQPELGEGHNVILIKRPIILHALRDIIESPESHMGEHLVKEQPRVRFAVPAKYVDTQSTEKATEPQEGPAAGLGEIEIVVEAKLIEETVLLVEDNAINQQLGRRLLEKLGYAVVAANDGQQALDVLSSSAFYCCFMDCQMPVLDGFLTTRRIRELEQEGVLQGHLPIIALTANVTSDSEARCREAGMDHFLTKPLVYADLDQALKTYGRPSPH